MWNLETLETCGAISLVPMADRVGWPERTPSTPCENESPRMCGMPPQATVGTLLSR